MLKTDPKNVPAPNELEVLRDEGRANLCRILVHARLTGVGGVRLAERIATLLPASLTASLAQALRDDLGERTRTPRELIRALDTFVELDLLFNFPELATSESEELRSVKQRADALAAQVAALAPPRNIAAEPTVRLVIARGARVVVAAVMSIQDGVATVRWGNNTIRVALETGLEVGRDDVATAARHRVYLEDLAQAMIGRG